MNFILLRGLIRHAQHWGHFRDLFQQTFPHSEILTPDLPGLGTLANKTTPTSIEENVHFLSTLLADELNQEEWSLVGLSLGGMVAAKWCELSPQAFRNVILLNPSSQLSPFWHRLNPQALPVFLRCFLTQNSSQREKWILSLTSNLKKDDSELVQSWMQIAEHGAIRRPTFLRQLIAARRFHIQPFDTPCMVLCSDRDRIVNPHCSERIAEYLGAELYQHHQAGHDLAIDAPDWTIGHIKHFIEEA